MLLALLTSNIQFLKNLSRELLSGYQGVLPNLPFSTIMNVCMWISEKIKSISLILDSLSNTHLLSLTNPKVHYVALAGLKPAVLLSQPFKCRDYRNATSFSIFKSFDSNSLCLIIFLVEFPLLNNIWIEQAIWIKNI